MQLLILHRLRRQKIIPQSEEGEHIQVLFIQALFPYIRFVLVMVMMLTVETLTMLTIPSSRNPPRLIEVEPPSERRR